MKTLEFRAFATAARKTIRINWFILTAVTLGLTVVVITSIGAGQRDFAASIPAAVLQPGGRHRVDMTDVATSEV